MKKFICGNCSTKVQDSFKFCPECGGLFDAEKKALKKGLTWDEYQKAIKEKKIKPEDYDWNKKKELYIKVQDSDESIHDLMKVKKYKDKIDYDGDDEDLAAKIAEEISMHSDPWVEVTFEIAAAEGVKFTSKDLNFLDIGMHLEDTYGDDGFMTRDIKLVGKPPKFQIVVEATSNNY